MEPLPLTREGYSEKQAELDALHDEARGLVARQRSARDLGDVSENGEYQATRERLAQVRARIAEVTADLGRARPIAARADAVSGVTIGATATVRDERDGHIGRRQVVAPAEAAPLAGKISAACPLGRALLGRRVGDAIDVATPAGPRRLTILAIRDEGAILAAPAAAVGPARPGAGEVDDEPDPA
jgi:transcription elongation factor GreA